MKRRVRAPRDPAPPRRRRLRHHPSPTDVRPPTAPPATPGLDEDFTPMIRRIAQSIHARLPPSVDVEDLVGEGTKGWLEARQRFDASRGTPFKAYARHSIRGRMLDYLRMIDFVPHSVRRKGRLVTSAETAVRRRQGEVTPGAVAAELDMPLERYHRLRRDAEPAQVLSLDAPLGADNPAPLVEQLTDATDPWAGLEWREMAKVLHEELDLLPPRNRKAVNLYYFKGWKLKRVGNVLSVTESRACQIVGQGVRELRQRLQRRLGRRLRRSGPEHGWSFPVPRTKVRPA